jgi:murein DD-endopeptidase MepM/ murein hydrolase activator NlpD
MKQYLAYKKQFNSIIVGIVLFIFFLLLPLVFSNAQTAQDIKDKINQKDIDIASLEKEIAVYQSQLDIINKQKNSLGNTLKELDLTKKKLQTDIAVTGNKIEKTNLTIQSLSSDINSKEDIIANNIESIKLGIRNIDEYERVGVVETILSENDFSLIWNDIDNLVSIREKTRADTTKLKQMKSDLEDTRQTTINAKNELLTLKTKLADQQKIVVQNTNEKNIILQQTKNSEANYQKLLLDRITKRDAFEKELLDYEAQLKYILDPSKLPSGRVLSWPLEKIFVTQLFGKTVDSKRLYASGTHSGVDFRASVGTPVMSMADGVVMGIGDTDLTCFGGSFGKFIFIKYNNGLSSAFGHLSLIKVKEGQKVRRGEVVGYSGATGHVTGPHLHISLYVSDAVKMASLPANACAGRIFLIPLAPLNGYLNALDYLPPYNAVSQQLVNQVAE